MVSACGGKSGITARAIGCPVGDVDILKSRYTREGSTTIWCARCEQKIFRCVSNPDRSRTECRPAGSGDACDVKR